MNTALYRLWEFQNTVTIKAISDIIETKTYNSLKWKMQRRSLNLTDEEKQIIADYLEGRIKELIKIKLLIDKEIKW